MILEVEKEITEQTEPTVCVDKPHSSTWDKESWGTIHRLHWSSTTTNCLNQSVFEPACEHQDQRVWKTRHSDDGTKSQTSKWPTNFLSEPSADRQKFKTHNKHPNKTSVQHVGLTAFVLGFVELVSQDGAERRRGRDRRLGRLLFLHCHQVGPLLLSNEGQERSPGYNVH